MNNELKFIVNKKNKTVTCIATGCEYDIIDDIVKKISHLPKSVRDIIYRDIGATITDEYLMPDKIVGVAKCMDTDKFDEDFGKMLAIKKMRYKYNRIKSNKIYKIYHNFWDIYDFFSELNDFYIEKEIDSAKHIDNYINQ